MGPPTSLSRDPPFRAEHLGSLLRPKSLLEAHGEFEGKAAGAEEQKKVEDEAINNIVAKQIDWGFRAINDGEYRRHMFWGNFFPSLEGMQEIHNPDPEIFRTYAPDIAAFVEDVGSPPGESVICTSKIRHPGKSVHVDQFEYVKTLVPQERWGDIKLTLPAPEWYHYRYKEGKAFPKDVYKNDEEYFNDIAQAYQTELDILYKAGLRNIQFDDPNFTYFCSEKMVEGWKNDSTNTLSPQEMVDAYINVYNKCIEKAPGDLHIGLHMCRGNYIRSRHFSEGGYDRIAKQCFQNMNVNTFYLEYDTPRAGGFEPLKYLPKNKNIILGVITSKFDELEDIEETKSRVYSAADIIATGNNETRDDALKRIGVSPQCGFASHAVGNSITREGMENKMKLVRKLADQIWPGQP